MEKNWGNQGEQKEERKEARITFRNDQIPERRFKEEKFHDLQETVKIAIKT